MASRSYATDELVRGVLEQGGLTAGVDFFLAFSPEREDPDHSTVDYELVQKHAPLIVDTRGIYRVPVPHVVKA